ncbi:thiopurine S-methyltransferase [Myxococcus stipitatus DSM 14675]|uniref:Thiopurine S-methyltransferase n=1 Tax=Myxococcus stipitatus (strain DSM 14675 / JCM 12634 / Mx s8) TaxID=1278073 RepID=L7UGR4_MYXSD|nr:class I SAM-dependent methyltransferase [Myxococcus stipitatus]AGC47055.1 thiopurine S-methyltransferase [Myxococcus stipitatus DSM 14675]
MWNERYSDAFASYGTEPNDFLREVAARIPEGPVLCLAEGEGRNAVFVARRGHAVTAVDLSEVGLANAAKLASERGVVLTTVLADLGAYDLGEARWAGIVSIWAHVPPEVRARLHAACVRALRPGGAFVLEAYTPRQLGRPGKGGPSDASLLMTPEGLREELAGLRLERCVEVDREVSEGRFHLGPSTTVQVLAFKPAP